MTPEEQRVLDAAQERLKVLGCFGAVEEAQRGISPRAEVTSAEAQGDPKPLRDPLELGAFTLRDFFDSAPVDPRPASPPTTPFTSLGAGAQAIAAALERAEGGGG